MSVELSYGVRHTKKGPHKMAAKQTKGNRVNYSTFLDWKVEEKGIKPKLVKEKGRQVVTEVSYSRPSACSVHPIISTHLDMTQLGLLRWPRVTTSTSSCRL